MTNDMDPEQPSAWLALLVARVIRPDTEAPQPEVRSTDPPVVV